MQLTNVDKTVKYATYDRPFRCGNPGACCCQQEIITHDGSNNNIGRAVIPFYWCIPTVNAEDEKGQL